MKTSGIFNSRNIVIFTASFILIFGYKLTAALGNNKQPVNISHTSDIAALSTVRNNAKELLQRTLTALDKGLNFMSKEHQNINLDGVIGTRIVEGQLKVLLTHIENGDYADVSNDVNIQIREMIKKASEVSDVATYFVKYTQDIYFARIGGIIANDFWLLDYPDRVTDPLMVEKPLYSGESMSETQSDDCLTELLGTSGKTKEKCVISEHCWDQMTAPGYRYYSLSHQLFYLQIGESVGCFKPKFLKAAEPLVQTYCATMLKEANDIVKAGYPILRRDLFMEQQALCGMSGFKDFFRVDWLEQILGWQWGQGCWGEHGLDKPSQNTRVKREEKILAKGCESHRTAVAISALVQYVRYIISYISSLPSI